MDNQLFSILLKLINYLLKYFPQLFVNKSIRCIFAPVFNGKHP